MFWVKDKKIHLYLLNSYLADRRPTSFQNAVSNIKCNLYSTPQGLLLRQVDVFCWIINELSALEAITDTYANDLA